MLNSTALLLSPPCWCPTLYSGYRDSRRHATVRRGADRIASRSVRLRDISSWRAKNLSQRRTETCRGGHATGFIHLLTAVGADMRITPNHPRLRLVALGCWAVSGWCIIQGGRLVSTQPGLSLMIVGVELLGLLLLAIGIAFWQMSVDTRAGIVFDAKGLLFNLGHSSAF